MSLKNLLFLSLISFWIFEPFLAFTAMPNPSKHGICSTCGMEDTCDEVCCCVGDSMTFCRQHAPGLYAAGCTPDHARNQFFSQSQAPYFIPVRYLLVRRDSIQPLASKSAFIPTPPHSIFSPPPELEHLS